MGSTYCMLKNDNIILLLPLYHIHTESAKIVNGVNKALSAYVRVVLCGALLYLNKSEL